MGEVDIRTLPQTTIRKIIRECVDKGLFDSTTFINSRPMMDYVPKEVANRFRPQPRKGRQTIRYTPPRRRTRPPKCFK